MPWLTVAMGCLTEVAILRFCVLEEDSGAGRSVGYLGMVLLLGLMLVGGSPSASGETRYAFFLYPVIILLGLVGGSTAIASLLGRRGRTAAAGLLCLAWLGAEDFSLQHRARIDSASVNSRVGLGGARLRHYYPRFDYRGVSDYVDAQAQPSDLVITSMLPAAWYLDRLDYVYMDERDPRFPQQSCRGGRMHVWSGRPLVHNMQGLQDVITQSGVAWMIASPDPGVREALQCAFDLELRYRDVSGALVAYRLAVR